MIRRSLIDLRPLRSSRDFRRLWWTQTVSVVGAQLMLFAVLLQVWELTRSPLWTGAVGLANAVPMIVVSLAGGALADSVDRRVLVLAGTGGQLVTAGLLTAQALAGLDSVGVVLALVVAHTTAAAISGPARRTFVPRLLPPELVPAGLALTHISFQGSMLLGPALAGVLAASGGVALCYLLDTLSFGFALYGVARLPALPPQDGRVSLGSAVGRVVEGLGFVVRRPVLRGALLSDLSATLLAFPVALFPMVNDERFGGSAQTLGLFLSSIAVGGIVASVLSGSYTRVRRQGLVMLWAAAAWCAALVVFGLADGAALTFGALVAAGAADTVSVVCRGTLTQLATPDALRGRVAAAEITVGMAGPDLGNARAGAVAAATSSTLSLASGGLLGLLGVALVAWRLPDVRRFRTPG